LQPYKFGLDLIEVQNLNCEHKDKQNPVYTLTANTKFEIEYHSHSNFDP